MTNRDCLLCYYNLGGGGGAGFGRNHSFVGGMQRKEARCLNIAEGGWDIVREGLGGDIGAQTAVGVYRGIDEETRDEVEGPNIG